MKKIIILAMAMAGTVLFAQNSNEDLKKEIEIIKLNISNLQSEIKSVKSENIYLKKVLDIQKPILEVEKEKTHFKIIGAEGNKTDKTIIFTFLLEAKDENKRHYISDSFIVDIDGNEIKMNLEKSSVWSSFFLSKDVPLKIKLAFTYKDIQNDFPKIIKVLRFRVEYKLMDTKPYSVPDTHRVEFRDININWK